MSETNTEQLIKNHLAALPEPVKKAIGSFDWARVVFDIGRKYNMHVNSIGDLQTEVMLVVLGLVTPAEFEKELTGRIETDSEKAGKIADEVNTSVFIRIRDFMKNYYEHPEGEDEGIESSERTVLKDAGISLDGDADVEEKEEVETPAEEEISFTSLDSSEAQDAVAAKEEDKKIDIPKAGAVFKTNVTTVGGKEVSKAYLDPYREPIN